MKRDNVVSTQSFPKDREIAAFSRAVIPLQRGPVTRRVFSSRTLRQYTFIKDPKLAAGGKLAQTGNDKLTEMKAKGNLALLIFPGTSASSVVVPTCKIGQTAPSLSANFRSEGGHERMPLGRLMTSVSTLIPIRSSKRFHHRLGTAGVPVGWKRRTNPFFKAHPPPGAACHRYAVHKAPIPRSSL